METGLFWSESKKYMMLSSSDLAFFTSNALLQPMISMSIDQPICVPRGKSSNKFEFTLISRAVFSVRSI